MLKNSRLMPRSAHIGVHLVHAVYCRCWAMETYFPTIPCIISKCICDTAIVVSELVDKNNIINYTGRCY
jgi:hypothetical protein